MAAAFSTPTHTQVVAASRRVHGPFVPADQIG